MISVRNRVKYRILINRIDIIKISATKTFYLLRLELHPFRIYKHYSLYNLNYSSQRISIAKLDVVIEVNSQILHVYSSFEQHRPS